MVQHYQKNGIVANYIWIGFDLNESKFSIS